MPVRGIANLCHINLYNLIILRGESMLRVKTKEHQIHSIQCILYIIGNYLTLEELGKSFNLINRLYHQTGKLILKNPSEKHSMPYKLKLKKIFIEDIYVNADGLSEDDQAVVDDLEKNQFKVQYKQINSTARTPMIWGMAAGTAIASLLYLLANGSEMAKGNEHSLYAFLPVTPFVLLSFYGIIQDRFYVKKANTAIKNYNYFFKPPLSSDQKDSTQINSSNDHSPCVSH